MEFWGHFKGIWKCVTPFFPLFCKPPEGVTMIKVSFFYVSPICQSFSNVALTAN